MVRFFFLLCGMICSIDMQWMFCCYFRGVRCWLMGSLRLSSSLLVLSLCIFHDGHVFGVLIAFRSRGCLLVVSLLDVSSLVL